MGWGWVARDEAVGKDRAQSSRALWATLRNAKSERVERGVCISERHVQGWSGGGWGEEGGGICSRQHSKMAPKIPTRWGTYPI